MANFPTSVSTNSNLYIAVNGVQTTLAASILATDTTIQLTSTSGFPTTGYVTIDNSEVVLYTGISGANLTGCTRGADGTSAAPHSLGVTVGATIVAAHHNLLKDEIIAIETALGANYAQASANTPNAVVKRDGSGNFSAGTITAALNGNASTATKSTNLAGGVAGAIPYQSAPDTTGFSAAGSAGDVILSGGTGAPTFNTPASAPTAGAIMKRDANANVRVNTVIENFTTTVTAAGTTNLTAASSPIQQFTGTTTQNVVLPDATTLSIGYQISVLNRSTGSVTVKDNSGTALLTIAANSQTTFTVTNISSAAGVWDASTSSGGTAVVNNVRYIVGTASGAYTGSLTVFDLPFAYIQDGKTLQVFYNGQMLSANNYTETSTTEVTMSTALVSGAEIVFRAVAAGASASTVTFFREDYVVGTALNNYTGSLTVFNLVNPYVPGGLALAVYLDGDLQTKGATVDYLETNSLTVTFNNSLVSGQKVTFLFAQAIAPAGTVNPGTAGQVAYFPTSTAQVAGSDALNVGTNGNGIIKGTTTNDNAAAGKVGEYIESVVAVNTAFPATGVFGDLNSISLTPGDWDISAILTASAAGGTVTVIQMGISTNSGNTITGLVRGSNKVEVFPCTSTTDSSGAVPVYRISISTTTTFYQKYSSNFTVATPQAVGRLSARRTR